LSVEVELDRLRAQNEMGIFHTLPICKKKSRMFKNANEFLKVMLSPSINISFHKKIAEKPKNKYMHIDTYTSI